MQFSLMATRVSVKGDYTFVPVLLTGVVFYCASYKLLSGRISAWLCGEAYRMLSVAEKKEWNARVNSTINAVLVSALCTYMLIYDRVLEASPLVYRSRLLRLNLSLLMGYLLADTFIMARHYRLIGDLMSIIHHLIAIIAFAYVVSLDVLPYLANLRLSSEFSTPFVNMRWFLAVLKHDKTSNLFLINGILMTVVFFTCRIATIPVFWYKVYLIRKITGWKHILPKLKLVFYAACIILDVLNLYWFSKIARGCVKTFRRAKTCEKND